MRTVERKQGGLKKKSFIMSQFYALASINNKSGKANQDQAIKTL